MLRMEQRLRVDEDTETYAVRERALKERPNPLLDKPSAPGEELGAF